MDAVEKVDLGNGYVGSIHYDSDAEFENDLAAITYNKSSRYVLGTEPVDRERFEEVGEKIESGEYIGLPVYAYVHSGSTISTSPFSCPWDSGRSGWVYLTAEQAIHEWGVKGGSVTEQVKEKAHNWLEGVVKDYASYLEGNIYYYLIKDGEGEIVDSCSNIVGSDEAKKMMHEAFSSITQANTAPNNAPKG